VEKSDSSRDTAAAKPAAAVRIHTQTFTPEPETRPQPRPRSRTIATLAFLQSLLAQWGYEDPAWAVAYGRWLGTRIARRKRNREPVMDEPAYARISIHNFFRQRGQHVVEAILNKYSPDEPPKSAGCPYCNGRHSLDYQCPYEPNDLRELEDIALRKAGLAWFELRDLEAELRDKEKLLAEWVRDDDGSDQDARWIQKARRRCCYLRGKIRKIQKGETV
jgi:hypothetical protein